MDLQKHFVERDMERRFRESRADLVQIIKDGQEQTNKRMDGLDKRMDGLSQEIKEVRQEVKDVNQRMDRHIEQTLSIKRWIIGLVISILLGIFVAVFPAINTVLNNM